MLRGTIKDLDSSSIIPDSTDSEDIRFSLTISPSTIVRSIVKPHDTLFSNIRRMLWWYMSVDEAIKYTRTLVIVSPSSKKVDWKTPMTEVDLHVTYRLMCKGEFNRLKTICSISDNSFNSSTY